MHPRTDASRINIVYCDREEALEGDATRIRLIGKITVGAITYHSGYPIHLVHSSRDDITFVGPSMGEEKSIAAQSERKSKTSASW